MIDVIRKIFKMFTSGGVKIGSFWKHNLRFHEMKIRRNSKSVTLTGSIVLTIYLSRKSEMKSLHLDSIALFISLFTFPIHCSY